MAAVENQISSLFVFSLLSKVSDVSADRHELAGTAFSVLFIHDTEFKPCVFRWNVRGSGPKYRAERGDV